MFSKTFNTSAMTLNIKLIKQADIWGSVTSALCLVHCLTTPLFFTLYANSVAVETNYSLWWSSLDLVFLAISFLAIIKSISHTLKFWVHYALLGNWGILAMIILNERFSVIDLGEEMIFLPTIALILLHLYNSKYCQCKNENCCANT